VLALQNKNISCVDSESIVMRLMKCGCRLALLLLPLGLTAQAQANGPLMPVHLRVGGREVACRMAPLADDDDTYIPLEALAAIGLEGKPDSKDETARVTALATRKHDDLALARPNGKFMLLLSDVARLVNARIVRTEVIGRDGKPKSGSKGDTVYLLARLTDARFQNGALRVTTSFPVPYRVHLAVNANPAQGILECIGAEVPSALASRTIASGSVDNQPLKVWAQQYSIDTARVFVDLPEGVGMKPRDVSLNPSAIIIAEVSKSETRVARSGKTEDSKPSSTSSVRAEKNDKSANSDKIARANSDTVPGTGKSANANGSVATGPAVSQDQGERASLQQPGKLGGDKNSDKNTGKTGQKTAVVQKQVNDPNAATTPPASDPDDSAIPPASTVPKATASAGQIVRPSLRGKSPSRGGSVKRALPIEVRGLTLVPDGDNRVHLDIATSDAAGTYVHYLPGGKLAVDIPNALLRLPDGVSADQTLTHPLLNGIHAELLQETPAVTRITCDTSRIVGFTVTNQSSSKISVDLRLPRNATGALADKVIVVDPGHGGSSTGAPGGGYLEKNITLQISLKLRDALEACGAKVVMTRDRDVDVNLYDRPNLANDINADLFVSIHNDSFTSDSRGTSTYYHMSDPSSRALANVVQQAIIAVSGIPSKGALSDGILYNSGLAVLRASKMPAILVEVAYISNAQDRRRLIDNDFQNRVANAICDGLRAYVEGGTPHGGRRMGMDVPDAPPLPGDADAATKTDSP
jgi:N-acetylmuramoyl-L-alanine amidase